MHLLLFLLACSAPGSKVTETGSTADDSSPGDSGGDTALADVVPLYDAETVLEHALVEERGDAIITRFADRGRDRHAREDEFQSYDHYLSHYWTHRTVRVRLEDTVAAGGQTIQVSLVTEWKLSICEFRAWFSGSTTVAAYSGNYAQGFVEEGPGTFDEDHVQVDSVGDQYRYTYTITSAIPQDGAAVPLAVGQTMEMEISQFLADAPEGRANYYGTAILYQVGVGGVVPWDAEGTPRQDSQPLDLAARLGGGTTLHANYSNEPDNHFLQMATNLSSLNGQPFVRGRRVHHTDMIDGSHDENVDNGTYDALVGLSGPAYTATSCDGCHHRNGRAALAAEGEALTRWLIRVGTDTEETHPDLGRALQPYRTDSGTPEGEVTLTWAEADGGLRRPVLAFSGTVPDRHSARIAPQLVGMGLLEAIDEATVLAWEDPADSDGDGISGRAQRVSDPETGDLRLGRFGWKAGTSSVRHQVAAALNGDMGVMTAMLPDPDCGANQTDCGNTDGVELNDDTLRDLVAYVSLLGIRPRRDIDDDTVRQGEALFDTLGCEDCHRAAVTTSPYHPHAELRAQTIHPYTDLLLHDMGAGLADTLGEGAASGAEWRTPPLWGIGLGACVTGGVTGATGSEVCVPSESYLHDGRARTLTEAILWHGGEGEASQAAFVALSGADQEAVLAFLGSL